MAAASADETAQKSSARNTSEEKTPGYLDPSPLGTKEYWSNLYSTDLKTREDSLPSHIGTTWFDDADAEGKTVRYLSSPSSSCPGLSRATASFLDLGTGNGSLLFALRKAGWGGKMVGVDYAEESVELARGIWDGIVRDGWEDDDSDESDEDDEKPSPSTEAIDFQALDILSLADSTVPLPSWTPKDGFDVVLDKGTFDAVSLSSETDPRTGKRILESYAIAAQRFLKKPDGRMVVTSCNWTESELERWFCSSTQTGPRLKVVDKVPYRTFRFGGKEGSVVVGIVFGWDPEFL